jgi:hypothetical protein
MQTKQEICERIWETLQRPGVALFLGAGGE